MREDGVVSGTDADVRRIERIRNDRLANLNLRGAVFLIVLVATAMSVIAAVIERLIDPAFDDMGIALWWAVTTVTTVGYGDIVPESHAGRAAASVLMLTGLALIPTLTSIVVATLVAQRVRAGAAGGAVRVQPAGRAAAEPRRAARAARAPRRPGALAQPSFSARSGSTSSGCG